MKKLMFILGIMFSFFASAQNIDIYTKWTSFPDANTQLILDLTDRGFIKLTRIHVSGDKDYRVDSFGFKRKCYASFKDLDSSRVFWIAHIESLHPSIHDGISVGEFIITKTNWNKAPIVMKMIDELPELGISFSIGDTLEFKRMVTKSDDEKNTFYPTFYGGSFEKTIYFGDNSGTSSGQIGVGMRYSPIYLNAMYKRRLHQRLKSLIDTVRFDRGLQLLFNSNTLDIESASDLGLWVEEINMVRQLGIFNQIMDDEDEGNHSGTIVTSNAFIHYPFRCGRNLVLIYPVKFFAKSKRKYMKYLQENQDQILAEAIFAMMNKKGDRQNLLNPGYVSVGLDVQLIKGLLDDFYFDEYGNKVTLQNTKKPYYYLFIAQTFSVNEYEQ